MPLLLASEGIPVGKALDQGKHQFDVLLILTARTLLYASRT